MRKNVELQRQSGVALWRQIADEIRAGLTGDLAGPQGRLPGEMALARRFGVNRHTVRAAIRALADEGVLQSRHGHGTFVIEANRVTYPLSARTRFSQGVGTQARSASGELLSSDTEAAPKEVAEALQMPAGEEVIRLETISRADGRPLARSTAWFNAARFSGIDGHYRETGSVTKALRALGVDDYVRQSTRIEAGHVNTGDARDLALSPGAIVLITYAVNTEPGGWPIQYARTRFAADRVSLTVENPEMNRGEAHA